MKPFATRKLTRSINNQKPKINSKTQNPSSKPKTQAQTQNPSPKPKSKTQNPNWRENPFQNPKPKTQNFGTELVSPDFFPGGTRGLVYMHMSLL